MRAGLPNKEPNWQKEWEEADVYAKRQQLNEGKPSFNLHDGPPYANGNIHVGHAMNKISKDIIVRSKSMSGFRAPYIPGWDTHGLPIEQVLAKKGVKRKEIPLTEYLEMCREYALSQVDKQREDFKRLGVSADWENPYITLIPEYEAAQIRVFGAMADKGYIYVVQNLFTGHGHLNQHLLKQKLNIMILIQHHFTMLIKLKMVKVCLILILILLFGQQHHLQ